MAQLEASVQKKINQWLEGNYDEATKSEIRSLLEKEALTELTDAFYRDLEFGTGGLRGIMGVGSNRINKYTIGAATQGFSNYLKQQFQGQEISVAIAHDSRNNATLFADVTASVFSANGIKVFYFDGLRPTPELSFAIRHLGCKGGVMLTASHNPKEYNGYKAYFDDGGQLISPHDKNVVAEVAKIASIDEIKFEANHTLIEKVGAEIDEAYYNALKGESIFPDAIARQHDLKIVFSPIHGTGNPSVPDILKRFGFTNVTVVEEQIQPDGNFPTVVYPNPEEKEALTLALKKADEIGADLVMATDPDADRVGIAIRNSDGELILLNGNQTGSLLMNYVLTAWKEAGKLDGNQYVVKTIVTSHLMNDIAASMNVTCHDVLTGFKFIGDLMTRLEGKAKFVVGGEESYGYLVGEHARDKDAVISCAMISEMAAFYKDQGKNLFSVLQDLYLQFGFYKEKLISITKKGKAGAEEIQQMMADFRATPPKELGGAKVVVIKDYQAAVSTDAITGEKKAIDLPKSNVLQFITADGDIISARPSGTEPKIKFYCSVKNPLESLDKYSEVESMLDAKVDRIMSDLGV